MAMTHAAKHDYDIRMFTTVFGNCSLDQVIKNVSKCRSAASCPGIKISRGCEFPIIKESLLDAAYFHGLDGLGNTSFPDEEHGISATDLSSAHHLLDIAAKAKHLGIELTVVMLGPLTNLAEAIRLDASFVGHIHHLVVMGGCGNARGNVFRTTEFNVVSDPEAASIVFHNLLENNKMCTIVSWELTLLATIPWKLFDELNNEERAKTSKLNNFLYHISSYSYGESKRGGSADCGEGSARPGAVICDAVAVAVAICSPEVCSCLFLYQSRLLMLRAVLCVRVV